MSQAGIMSSDALRGRIQNMMNVSTISASLKKIIELTGNPNTIIHELVKTIECDQAIAMKVLAASNGAFYGYAKKISTVSQATLILGFDTVRALAITTTVFSSMNPRSKESINRLWSHSLETAEAAAIISNRSGLAEKETAFTSGLLHDIGRPIIFQTCDDLCAFERGPLEKEEAVFGASHAEAGAWFAERFKLPESSIDTIRYHHSPEKLAEPDRLPPLVAITYLANFAVTDEKNVITSPAHDRILALAKLKSEDLKAIGEEVGSRKRD